MPLTCTALYVAVSDANKHVNHISIFVHAEALSELYLIGRWSCDDDGIAMAIISDLKARERERDGEISKKGRAESRAH